MSKLIQLYLWEEGGILVDPRKSLEDDLPFIEEPHPLELQEYTQLVLPGFSKTNDCKESMKL